MEFLAGFIFGMLIVVVSLPVIDHDRDLRLRHFCAKYLMEHGETRLTNIEAKTKLLFNYIKYGTSKDKTDRTVD